MSSEPTVKSILLGTKSDGTLTPVLVDTDGNLIAQLEASPTIDIGDVTLLAGTAEIGKLAAGTAIIGKVGVDQTTDATTNAVNVLPTSGAAANTARTTATKVLAVQHVDAVGNVLSASPVLGANAVVPTQITKTVAAIATPEALAADGTFFQTATIIAKKAARTANTGIVYLGIGATNDTQALPLNPGDVYEVNAPVGQKYDLNDFYLDVATAADGVVIIYS